MSRIKVGINGMGRIGRTILRELLSSNPNGEKIEVVAVNNPGPADKYVHLLKYDSTHGKFDKEVGFEDGHLLLDSQKIPFYGKTDPSEVPWSDCGAQIVIDGTGVYRDKEGLSRHLGGTVKKVILCAPGKDVDGTFVLGINEDQYVPDSHHIISNASCTTNCLAPVAKVLHENFGIENGFMTTIHSYTSDQKLLDGAHGDLRRARSAAVSMIPTTTGAARAVGLVFPDLKGKLDGYAVRVPTPNVSLVDLAVNLSRDTTVEEVNKVLKEASEGSLRGILGYTDEELVSCDFISSSYSSVVDASLTNVIGRCLKVVSWYDNEAGFSNRVIDLATYIGEKL